MLRADAIIDIHAHFQLDASGEVVPMRMGSLKNLDRAFVAEAERRRAEYDEKSELTRRLAELDAAGIDFQVLSMTHPIGDEWRTENPGNDYCAHVNDRLAEFVRRAPDRLGGFAKLNMEDKPAAIRELRRSVEKLGLLGGLVITNFELDAPAMEPFYDALEELDVPLFIHGNLPGWIPSLFSDRRLQRRSDLKDWAGKEVMGVAGSGDDWGGRYHLGSSFLFLYEESLMAIILVMSGILDRHPRLKVCIAHAGGTVALAAARVGSSLGLHPQLTVKTEAEFHEKLKRLWVDSDIQSAKGLELVMAVLNPEQVVLGTDFPGWGKHPLDIYGPELTKRLSGNGRRLLRLGR